MMSFCFSAGVSLNLHSFNVKPVVMCDCFVSYQDRSKNILSNSERIPAKVSFNRIDN